MHVSPSLHYENILFLLLKGQFSSSPIQGGARTYSLGSITSPSFPEGSPARNGSPTFSPIAFHIRHTPLSGMVFLYYSFLIYIIWLLKQLCSYWNLFLFRVWKAHSLAHRQPPVWHAYFLAVKYLSCVKQ